MNSSDHKINNGFLVVIIAFSLGLGSFDRLPYLLYKYSDTPFLLIYFACTMLLICPMLYMEMYLGSPTKEHSPLFNLRSIIPKNWHFLLIPLTIIPIGMLIYFLAITLMPILYSSYSLNLFHNMSMGEFLSVGNYKKFDVFFSHNLEHNFSYHFIITSGLLLVSTILLIDKGIVWRLVTSGIVLVLSVCVLALILLTNCINDGSLAFSFRTMLSFTFTGFGFNIPSFHCIVDAIYYAFFTVGTGSGLLIAVSYKFSLSPKYLFKDVIVLSSFTFFISLIISYTIIAMLHEIGEAPSYIGIKSLFIDLPNYFYGVEDGQFLSIIFYGVIAWCYFYALMLVLISIFTNLRANYHVSIYHRFIIFLIFVALDIVISNIDLRADLFIKYVSYIYRFFYHILLPFSMISMSIVTGYLRQIQTYKMLYKSIALEDPIYKRKVVGSILFTIRVIIPMVSCFLFILSILFW